MEKGYVMYVGNGSLEQTNDDNYCSVVQINSEDGLYNFYSDFDFSMDEVDMDMGYRSFPLVFVQSEFQKWIHLDTIELAPAFETAIKILKQNS